jgi:hypothetical protein
MRHPKQMPRKSKPDTADFKLDRWDETGQQHPLGYKSNQKI